MNGQNEFKRSINMIHTPASSIVSLKRKTWVTQRDVHTISDNDNLSPAVVDAYLTIIKQANRKDVLLNKTVDKVLGFSSSLS